MQKSFLKSDEDWNRDFYEYLKENKTLAYMMLDRCEKYADRDALTQRVKGEWVSITWKEFGEQIRALGKAILEMNILQPGEMGGIFSQNCVEWAIADLGILSTRAVCVPIYATNSAEEAEYIINDAEIKILFVGDQDQYEKAKKIIPNNQYLTKIVAFNRDIKIRDNDSVYFNDFLDIGRKSAKDKEFEVRLNNVDPDDMLTLIYTSGTTGPPKGAIHSNRTFMNGMFPTSTRFREIEADDVTLAILPLSHVFERMWSYGCMSMGIKIAYCPDPKEFIDVMAAIKPQYMTSVPRIWEKVYGTIHEGLKNAPLIKKKLFNWTASVGIKAYRRELEGKGMGMLLGIQHKIADQLIMKKVRATLGTEKCKVYHIGGAAFAREINEFFQGLGINITQGYGLTEFFPVAVGFERTGQPGGCGPIIPMCQARISDDGEIQIKGGMCMKGYHKKPEATAECFTEDGWFKTQDIGTITERQVGDVLYSYITITDRIKELIITAGGKNISPQQIEMLLGDELFVEQFVAIGEGKKFISALVVPNFEILDEYCKKNKIEYSSKEELVKKAEIVELYEKVINKKTSSLGRVEQVKNFILLTEEMTQEGGELTPTMKLKRKYINEKYKDQIEQMYEE